MYLAQVEGTVVATVKHSTMESCRFLLTRRLESDGTPAAEPQIVLDWMGAMRGQLILVSTDGDIARVKLGNTTPARLVVAGIVDNVSAPGWKIGELA
jgi:ethanolamine utilization protein EutN